jgi:predicted RNase H-like HicB family nuclease
MRRMLVSKKWLTLEEALMARYPFRVAVDEDGYHAMFPDLPGCAVFAQSLEEFGEIAPKVLRSWLEGTAELRGVIPAPIMDEEFHWKPSAFRPGYTSHEAAALLGISVRRVQALARSRGVGRRHGRALLFSQDDLEALRKRKAGRPLVAVAA